MVVVVVVVLLRYLQQCSCAVVSRTACYAACRSVSSTWSESATSCSVVVFARRRTLRGLAPPDDYCASPSTPHSRRQYYQEVT